MVIGETVRLAPRETTIERKQALNGAAVTKLYICSGVDRSLSDVVGDAAVTFWACLAALPVACQVWCRHRGLDHGGSHKQASAAGDGGQHGCAAGHGDVAVLGHHTETASPEKAFVIFLYKTSRIP